MFGSGCNSKPRFKAELPLMKIPAGCTSRFQFHSRLPEFFGNEMNDTIFNLELTVIPRKLTVLAKTE